MPDSKPTAAPTPPTQMLAETRQETREIHGDTRKILGLLEEPAGAHQEEDRIDQILGAFAEVLTSLASLHDKVDRLAGRRSA